MDLVDIDKVLDDFELNEDNSHSDTGITNISLPNNNTSSGLIINHENTTNTTTTTTNSSANSNCMTDKLNLTDGLLNHQQQQNGSQDSPAAFSVLVPGISSNTNSITTPTKSFVNVSNVFSSLNEYVNAGKDKNLELLSTNTEKLKLTSEPANDDDDDSSHSTSSDSYIKSEQLNQIEINRDTRKLISKHRDDTSGSNSPGISSRASSQTSSTTSSRRTSLTTTPTSSDNEDDEELLTKTNDQSLKPLSNMDSSINTDDFNNHESILQNSDLKTTNNTAGINNRTNTIFSSSSSYCYNENNSSDVTFSNDIVSLNETSSLSSLINLSNNETGIVRCVDGGEADGAANKNVVDIENQVSDPVLVLNNDNNHILSIDNSNDVTSGRVEMALVVKNDQEVKAQEDVVEEKNNEPTTSQQVIDNKPVSVEPVAKKPIIGFESTMDDVSDTELESYLQELEFETTNSAQNQLSVIKSDEHEIMEDVEVQESQDVGEVGNTNIVECDNDSNVNELIEQSIEHIHAQSNLDVLEADTPSTSDDIKEDKNVDNISQASTVECNEIITSHTDFEEKCISSDEVGVVEESVDALSVEDVVATSDEDPNSILNIEITAAAGSSANQDTTEPLDLTGNSDEMKIDETSDGINPGTSSSSSQLKRPNTLNFPSPTISEQIPSPGQTPPLKLNNPDHLNDQSQLSSSSSDEMTNSSMLTQNNLEETNTSGLPVHQLGKIPPYWVPDSDALNCMHCNMKFSFRKRRHHCRACGKVLCSTCCSIKSKLEYLGDAEARICQQCDVLLKNRDSSINNNSNSMILAGASGGVSGGSGAGFSRSPNPNNPMEYCSRLPPHQQVAAQQSNAPISVMVPVGVLKREGAPKTTRKEKNVIFSDGIRPGCDLTELDNNWDTKSSSSSYGRKSGSKRVQTPPDPSAKSFRNSIKLPKVDESTNSYIPKEENGLPPIFVSAKIDFDFIDVTNNAQLITRLKQEEYRFAVQRNLYVIVKILKLSCCINKTVINFTTQGMRNVGQDEIIILLELDESNIIPKDIFLHLNEIYLNADKGQIISELGFSMPHQINFLGSKEHGGFLYIRPTFQCFQGVAIPESPYLIGILIHRWEVPWAKLFPLRLMLRLGALYRYYPSPHISERGRDSVYAEIAQTVINFLADFRSYTYTLATIRGMTIHMEDRKTTIQIPKNRYDQVIKTINHSSDHILALGGVFSKKADGHLVCIQNTESGCSEMYQYSTQAINIQGQPRKVTGASFLILNGALKTSSGLSGKCTIVEDGLMVQILPETMVNAREALKNMKDFNIICGPVDAPPEQQETVSLLWVENDLEFNVGVFSPIDNKPMDGIPSIRVHKGLDYSNNCHTVRWTEVFILKSDEESPHGRDQIDVSKVSEKIGRSTAVALVPFLDLLAANGLRKLGLRVTLDQENVCYEAGSQQTKLPPLYMNALDNELIPTLHRQTTSLQTDTPIELELIFHILDK